MSTTPDPPTSIVLNPDPASTVEASEEYVLAWLAEYSGDPQYRERYAPGSHSVIEPEPALPPPSPEGFANPTTLLVLNPDPASTVEATEEYVLAWLSEYSGDPQYRAEWEARYGPDSNPAVVEPEPDLPPMPPGGYEPQVVPHFSHLVYVDQEGIPRVDPDTTLLEILQIEGTVASSISFAAADGWTSWNVEDAIYEAHAKAVDTSATALNEVTDIPDLVILFENGLV